MKKKVKKIWLMGKLRNLEYEVPGDFEWSVNYELKRITNGQDLSGFKVTLDEANNSVKFWWPIILKDFKDKKESLPEPLMWLILGKGRSPFGMTVAHFPGFLYSFYIPDIIEDYKKLARQNHASRIKGMTLTHSNTRGMEMELQF
jgi:hypothetical protein